MDAKHPAKFTDTILETVAHFLQSDWLVLDPFAGVGKLSKVASRTVLVEIEPEWATQCPHDSVLVADALHLPLANDSVDAIVTSPTYGNRMADHHNAKDGSRRISYTHTLGRKLHSNNSGQIQWGEAYREFHRQAWKEADRVLKKGGLFILNISAHFRKGCIQPVPEWHYKTIIDIGYDLVDHKEVATPRLRRGENWEKRVDHEDVFVFRK